MKKRITMKNETNLIHLGRPEAGPDVGMNSPISLNSTLHAGGDIGYARYGNQSCLDLENAIASLEHGKTLAFSSGMSAFNAIASNIPQGSIIVASDQGYAGITETLRRMHQDGKIILRFVDIANTKEVLDNMADAFMVWIETPTNPLLKVADLEKIIKSAKNAGALVGVDNTFATPLRQVPLDMGADISLNSVTKYMAGHSDVLAGSISTNNNLIFDKIEFTRKLSGTIIQPFEAYLALRGMRTFSLRFEKAETNAKILAQLLSTNENVKDVFYPGFSGVISFDIYGTAEDADLVCNSARLISNTTSLGAVESTWERRRRWQLESHTVPESLIRLSVGCENIDDLWVDIKSALEYRKMI
jgi:cystathionine gamma-synthase